MDWLLTIEPDLAKQAYFQVTDLLNLEVDLLFFDTTSTYFETERRRRGRAARRARRARGRRAATRPGKEAGFRTHGKSKDSRDDLPQVVIGMAVTRDGIPVRVWCWPGNTTDSALIRQVRDDMRDWTLSRVIWVADRGFTSAQNRRDLMQGGGGYIIGEKLRSGSARGQGRAVAAGPLRRRPGQHAGQGSPHRRRDDRFVICYNPAQAERDAAIRAKLIAQLEEADHRHRHADRDQARRARGQLSPASPA